MFNERHILEKSAIKTRITTVKSELGMHARPASKIAQMAGQATSDVWLSVDADKVDATSIIDILTLGAVKGTRVMVEIENDADIATLDEIVEFFEDSFGEA